MVNYWCPSCKEWVHDYISAPATNRPTCPSCGSYLEAENVVESDLDTRWRVEQ